MAENRQHILLVEDTDAVREVIARQLRALGCDVTEASDGMQAFSMMETGIAPPITMVVTDLNMPHMNGQQLRDKMRARTEWENIRVVLLTADPVPKEYRDNYLQKPIALEDLKCMVEGKNFAETNANKKQSLHAIDREALIEQMGELDDGAIEMLKLFPKMMHPILDDVRAAIIANDFIKLEAAAHSLKGAARSAGALNLGKICNEIQNCALQQSSAHHLLDNLDEAYRTVEIDLDQIGRT